jgi:hypothetical protein
MALETHEKGALAQPAPGISSALNEVLNTARPAGTGAKAPDITPSFNTAQVGDDHITFGPPAAGAKGDQVADNACWYPSGSVTVVCGDR